MKEVGVNHVGRKPSKQGICGQRAFQAEGTAGAQAWARGAAGEPGRRGAEARGVTAGRSGGVSRAIVRILAFTLAELGAETKCNQMYV